MLGHLAGDRIGAWTYDLAHTAPLPVALLAAGLGWHTTALTVAGVVGLVHIGLDRLLDYGVPPTTASTHPPGHQGANCPAQPGLTPHH